MKSQKAQTIRENKSLKESQENTNNPRKWINPFKKVNKNSWEKKTVQDLKIEIEEIKKMSKERIQGKKLGIKTETREASFTNRIKEMEEKIPGIDDKMKKQINQLKKMLNPILLKLNVQEILNIRKY